MLTRIEVNGFKTFHDLNVDLGPYVALLGANASGKSNFFDALQLLAHLAYEDIRTAVKSVRGETHELFFCHKEGQISDEITLAAEFLLDPIVQDPWGGAVELTHTRVRYELTIARREDTRGIERLLIINEQVLPILKKNDMWARGQAFISKKFRDKYLKYKRQTPWLQTDLTGDQPSFQIFQDERQGRSRPAHAAETTVLSTITTTEFPHLYALREELRSWKFMQLDPSMLRKPSPTTAPETLLPDGSNLATVLARLRAETATPERPDGILADIVASLTNIIPSVSNVEVIEDKQHREFRLEISMQRGPAFSSRVASDGTLRVLALLTMIYDPQHHALLLFEEPENGVHPARLKLMMNHLRELIVGTEYGENDDNYGLSQVIMNSHSPVVLSVLTEKISPPADIFFVDVVSVAGDWSEMARRTRIRKVCIGPQGSLIEDVDGRCVTQFEVDKYLSVTTTTPDH